MWVLGTELGPLQGQQVFFTAEPSLQPASLQPFSCKFTVVSEFRSQLPYSAVCTASFHVPALTLDCRMRTVGLIALLNAKVEAVLLLHVFFYA